ncbi:MAG: hypothetical protein ACM30G_02585 [Micromonosporaceae bacterium]
MSAHRRSHTSRLHAGLRLTRAAASMAAAICISTVTSRRFRTVGLAAACTLTLTFGAISLSREPAPAQQPQLVDLVLPQGSVDEIGQWCVDHNTAAFRATLSTNARNVLRACVELWGAGKTPSPTPSPSPSPTATASPTGTPTGSPTPSPTATTPGPSPTTPAPSPTTPSPSPTPSPTASPSPSPTPSPTTPSSWPDATNTGVPAGTTLSVYTGPCTITVSGTVIDAKLVSCDLDIATTGVRITRSSIGGTVSVASPTSETAPRLTISDSVIDAGHRQVTGLGDGLFVATKLEIRGGNRGVLCAWRCTLQDSWVHGTYVESNWHASGVRAERYSTIIHNTIACDWLVPTAQDGGCSADLTGYADFAAPHDWIIQDNFFVANPNGAAFCAYGGSSGGKPYSNDPLTGTSIQFIGNVFQRGSNRACAAYGPIDAFNPAKAGAVWSGNRYDDGAVISP